MIEVIVAALLLCLLWLAVRHTGTPVWVFYVAAIVVAVLFLLGFVGTVPRWRPLV